MPTTQAHSSNEKWELMSSREVIKRITVEGWYEVRQRGSHVQFRHDERDGLVTVPHPNKDVPRGTIRSIERQSGVKLL